MSNLGTQTRGLSAGDWVRLKRLRGARTSGYTYTAGGSTYAGDLTTNVDLDSAEANGTSNILRPASKWTDFVASRNADYVTQSQAVGPNGTQLNGNVLRRTTLCNCTTAVLNTKAGLCRAGVVSRYAFTPPTITKYTGPNSAIHPLTVFKNVLV
jgi:hypothetical protein